MPATTVSAQKLAANRQNAQKSTGPSTPEGKKQVRYNAVKHALYGVLSPELLMAVGERDGTPRSLPAKGKQQRA